MLQSKKQISYLYNPANQTPQEIKDNFVVRGAEFRRILRDIKNTQEDETPQNFLIIAQRGMGKTTLLLRLQYEIKNDSSLSHLIPIQLSEEQYNIFSLCNLWEAVADELEEIESFKGIAEQLQSSIESDIENCFEVIRDALVQNRKRIVLLVDNFGDMLDKFSDIESKELRDILHGSHLQMITASSRVLEETYKHDKALFEYFNLVNLKGLSQKETMTLFESLSKTYHDKNTEEILKNQRSRIEIIRRLTGGVPRTMILLFEIFMDESADVFEDLELILDRVTPLYKHRMDDLSPKLQKIAHEMALAWDGVTFEEIQAKTRIEKGELDSNLLKLEKNDLITVRPIKGDGNVYQLSERFFNIWYLMRYGRKNKKEHILWLVKFLQVWCTPDELKERVYGHIHLLKKRKMKAKGAFYLSEAYGEMLDDRRLKHELVFEAKELLKSESPELAKQITIDKENIFYESRRFAGKGNNHSNKGEYDQALVSYKKAIELNPKYDLAYNNMGVNYHKKGEYDKAIASYEKVIELNPRYVSAYCNMGNSYRKKGEYDQAIEYYKKAIEIDDKYSYAYSALGRVYENQKEYDKAIEYYKKAIEVDDKYVHAYNNLGSVYYNQKEYDKAIEYYKKAIELDDKDVKIYWRLGNCFYFIKDKKKAKDYWKKSIKLDSLYLVGYRNLGLLAKEEKKYDEALKYYKKVIELDNENIEAYLNIGEIYESKEDYDNSIKWYENAIAVNSMAVKAYQNIGNIYNNKKDDYDKAIEYYMIIIEKKLAEVHHYNNLGIFYKNKKEYDKAIEWYKKAIEVDDKYVYAYKNLGNVYKTQKEYDKAIEYYKKAIEVDSKYVHAYNNLGIVYKNQKEYDKAIEYYKKAIEVDSKYVHAYNNLGIVYKNQKEYDKAIEYYKKAIEVDDKEPIYYNNIGNVYKTQKEYDKAIEYYKKAIEVDKKYSYTYSKERGDTYIVLGFVSAKNKNYNQAIEFGEKALKENPKLYNFLSLIYFFSNKNKKEAIKLIDKALKEKNNDENNAIKMMIQAWNREYNESIVIFKKLIIEEINKSEESDDEVTTDYLLFLISQKQYKLTNELFTNKELNLKNRFKPIYYTLMYFMQDEYPTEYKRMGEELRETVEEMLVQVKELEEKYSTNK